MLSTALQSDRLTYAYVGPYLTVLDLESSFAFFISITHQLASSDNKRPDILAGGLIIIIIMWIAAALAASLQPCNLCAHVVSSDSTG